MNQTLNISTSNLQRKFYELWAQKARISVDELLELILKDSLLTAKRITIPIDELAEVRRVLGLKPETKDIKLSMFEKLMDWLKSLKRSSR